MSDVLSYRFEVGDTVQYEGRKVHVVSRQVGSWSGRFSYWVKFVGAGVAVYVWEEELTTNR